MICSIGNIQELNGWNAVLGFVILFAVLLAVAYVVKVFGAKKKRQETGKEGVSTVEIAEAEDTAEAPGSSGEMTLYNVTEREAAMVIAIVADEMGTPVNELKFISIKKKAKEETK